MPILTFGINHKTAPVNVRERLAFNQQNLPDALQTLLSQPAVNEAVLLSTCNRTEIYGAAEHVQHIEQWLKTHRDFKHLDIKPYSYHYYGLDAVKHMMRVASGLDSMMLGEPQILGQMKAAYLLAREAGGVGQQLQQLFPAIFAVTKQIRSETGIGANPVSIAFAAVQLAKRIFSNLSSTTVLLVGAGETTELVATHFNSNGVTKMVVANRTIEKAQQLAGQFNAQAIRIGDIPAYLNQVDIIVSATASQLPILGKGMFETALKQKRRRALFLVDLAVPRDIEPEVSELEDVYLYNIDDLQSIVKENLKNREQAAVEAEAMVSMQAEHFMRKLHILNAGDMITRYREKVNQVRDRELQKALQQLQNNQDPQAVLSLLAHNLTNKVMHQPTVKMRQAAYAEELEKLLLIQDLFDL